MYKTPTKEPIAPKPAPHPNKLPPNTRHRNGKRGMK